MHLFLNEKRYIKRVLFSFITIGIAALLIITYKILQPCTISDDLPAIVDLCDLKTLGIGMRADSRVLDQFAVISPPPLSRTGKTYLTLNRMGFDTLRCPPLSRQIFRSV